jgi:hypothetical protein
VLPKTIQEAIESKLAAEQLSLQYDFLLQKELKEADRKRIEAAGIRDFQKIATQTGLFDRYLRFEGIKATLSLAESNNSKVILFGNKESNGLPLIFSLPADNESSESKGGIIDSVESPANIDINDYLSEPTKKMLSEAKGSNGQGVSSPRNKVSK